MQCFNNLLCITDSEIFDRVGKSDIGRKDDLSVFGPDLLYTAVIWAIFQLLGKYPISNILFKSLESEKEIGVAIKCINLPGVPKWEKV